ncbi:hypothetical protein D3C71_1509930 [compost metagenome]
MTTLNTPGGKPASSNNVASSSVEAEVNSDGLTTTVQPAAMAGAIFQLNSINGEFQGVIAATTPTGSCRVKAKYPFLSSGSVLPCTLSARPP